MKFDGKESILATLWQMNERTCCSQLVLQGLRIGWEGGSFQMGIVQGQVQGLEIDGFNLGAAESHDTHGIVMEHLVEGPSTLTTAERNNLRGEP
jgi:hypothetical protein